MKLEKLLDKNKINVYIGSDHAGFDMKEELKKDVELNKKINFIDVGPLYCKSVDYPDYAKKLGDAVVSNKAYGIGICGTGIGISIALNKIKGVYAALVYNEEVAELAKKHNNANIIALSGRFINKEENIKIVKSFFNSQFEGGRHEDRINKIKELEKNL